MRLPTRLLVTSLVLTSMVAGAAAKKKKPAAGDADSAPEITLTPVVRAILHEGVIVEATITDSQGVFEPKLYFRPVGDTKYFSIEMGPAGSPDRFRAEIPGTNVAGPVEYFVEAYDANGNGPARSAPQTRPHKLFPVKEEPAAVVKSDARAPDVVHVVPARAPQGRSLPIEASFRGPSGVYNPVLHFRRIGNPEFTALAMAELPVSATAPRAQGDVITGPAGTGRFVAEVPGAFTTGDIEYYLEVMDAQGNGPAFEGSRDRPHVVLVFEAEPEALADPDAALSLCRDLAESKADSAKAGACRRVPADVPPAALARFAFGNDRLRENRPAEACEAFDEATTLAPSWPAAFFRLGQAREATKEWAPARAAYARYLALVKSPPEEAALAKKLATIEYAQQREDKERAEADARREADRIVEDEKRLAREDAEKRDAETRSLQQILSGPASHTFVGLGGTSFTADRTGAGTLALRFRLKIPAFPAVFFGLGLQAHLQSLADGSIEPYLSFAPQIGVNLLALPSPSGTDHCTALSPFFAYQPLVTVPLLAGQLPGADGVVAHTLLVGNHFEYGQFSFELAAGRSVGLARGFTFVELSLGRQLGAQR